MIHVRVPSRPVHTAPLLLLATCVVWVLQSPQTPQLCRDTCAISTDILLNILE